MTSYDSKLRYAVAIIASLFANPSWADPVILTVAIPSTNNQRVLQQKLAQQFMAEHPDIEVKLDTTSTGYDDLVQRTLRAAITGGLPDVAYYSFNRIQLLVDRGVLVPIDRFLSVEKDLKKLGYIDSVLKLAKVDGHTYGLPFNISVPLIYFNASLVKEGGGNPDNLPKTWAGITALAAKIKSLGGNRLGMYYDYYDSAGNWSFMALVESFCGRMMSNDKRKITFNDDGGMNAFKVFESIGRSGMVDMSKSQAQQAFMAGTMGIVVFPASYLEQFEKGSQGRFKVEVVPFPVPCADGRLPAGGSGVTMLAKDPKHQAAAWEWIKYVTGPKGQTLAVRETGYMPTNTLAVEDEQLLGTFYRDHPEYLVSVKQLPIVSSFFSFPGANSIKITKVIKDHLREVITLQRPPAQVMSDMVRDVKVLLPVN